MDEQGGLKSADAYAQCSRRCPHEEALGPWLSIKRPGKTDQRCADAQAYRSSGTRLYLGFVLPRLTGRQINF